MNKRQLGLMIGALLLSGCSMAPDYDVPTVAMNDVYLNQVDSASQPGSHFHAAWWEAFQDAQLNRLVSDAQRQNITLKIASERIQAAQSYHKAVASLKVPTVSISGGVADIRLSENEAMMGGMVRDHTLPSALGGGQVRVMDRDQTDYFLGLNASWELDVFGRIDSMSQAAAIRAEQAAIMKQAVTTLITADVINNYLQYRGAQERIAIADENIRDQEEMLRLVESLNRHGYGSELDVANAKANLAATRAMVPKLETAKSVHLNRLAILLGENLHKTEARLAGQSAQRVMPSMHGVIPTGLPSELLTRRPDIALAEREIAARNQEVGAAIANQYPRFFLTGSPGVMAGDFGDLFDSGSDTWMLGAGFSWNIFDAGRNKAMVDMQEAGFRQSVLSYQDTVNAAFNEVETALRAYGNSQQFEHYLKEAEQQAETALGKANSLYKSGLVNHLSVLDAQRQKNQVQDAEVLARLNTASSVVMLHKALGGDWNAPAARLPSVPRT